MSALALSSVGDPFDRSEPDLTRAGVDLLVLADAVGLLGDEPVERLDLQAVRRVARLLRDAGIGPAPGSLLQGRDRVSASDLRQAVRRLQEALESSPMPEMEWKAMSPLLGIEALAGLLGVSPVSLRRYASGARATPDDVAARLHHVAKVVAALKGAYNDIGIRRWFVRKRTALGGRSPAQLLRDEWDPDAAGPRRVRALAESLLASAAT